MHDTFYKLLCILFAKMTFTRGQDIVDMQLNRFTFLFLMLMVWSLIGCGSDDPTEVMEEGDPATLTPTEEAETSTAVPEIIIENAPPVSFATPDASRETVILDIGMIGSVATFDPQISNTDNEVDVIENIFVGLTRYNHLTNQVEGQLAESWAVSDNGLTWTFELRNDIFWVRPIASTSIFSTEEANLEEVQTVRQVIAQDVVTAIQRACDPEISTPDVFILFVIAGCEAVNQQDNATAADLERIGAKAIDPFTLEIQLNKPASYFLSVTTLPMLHPVPREIIAETEDQDIEWATPDLLELQTSGPYLYSPASVQGKRLVLERNPFWPIPFNNGAPDVVHIWEFNEPVEGFDMWLERDLDLTVLPTSRQEEMFERSGQKILLVPEQAVFYLAYNFDSPIFNNPALRRAFGAAINREELIETVYNEQGIPMRHFTPPGVWGAPPVGEIGAGYDPDYARLQLAAAGYITCSSLPEIRYLTNSSDTALFQAETIRDMWVEELGCEQEQIIIEQVQFGTLLANTRQEANPALRPDVWDLGWASYYPDAHNWLHDVLHCNNSDNRSNRPCGEVDQQIERAQSATPEQRVQIYRQIEDAFFGRDDGLEPLTPLFTRGSYILRQTWVQFEPAIFGGEQFDTYFIDWELKKIEQQQ